MRESFSRVEAARSGAGDVAANASMDRTPVGAVSSMATLPHGGYVAGKSRQDDPDDDVAGYADRRLELMTSPRDAGRPTFDILAEKAGAAFDVLQGRFANRISEAEVDHLFACFVFGLTSPVYTTARATDHLDICRTLTALRLPPERVHAALHEVPAPSKPWVEHACETLERQGTKIGRSLAARMPVKENRSDANGYAAASTDGKIEERQP